MGFFKSSKKKVPQELPNLLIDKIATESLTTRNSVSTPISESASPAFSSIQTSPQILQSQAPVSTPQENAQQYRVQPLPQIKNDKGFFKELLKSVHEDAQNLEKLEKFYESAFEEKDMVRQMKDYWEKQKPQLLIDHVGKDLKEKMLLKTESMHRLEKEWQEIYATLIAKEDQIRQEEKELKQILGAFMDVCKSHLGKEKRKQSSQK